MIQRFFRADNAVYEMVRTNLDAAWGLPAHGQITCLEPAVTAPHGPDGLVYLGTWGTFCDYDDVRPLLTELLASGAVEEITAEQYREACEPKAP